MILTIKLKLTSYEKTLDEAREWAEREGWRYTEEEKPSLLADYLLSNDVAEFVYEETPELENEN